MARFSMTHDQWASFGKSLWKYTAPLLLMFLLAIQDGKPVQDALLLVYGAALQVAISFVSKFVSK